MGLHKGLYKGILHRILVDAKNVSINSVHLSIALSSFQLGIKCFRYLDKRVPLIFFSYFLTKTYERGSEKMVLKALQKLFHNRHS